MGLEREFICIKVCVGGRGGGAVVRFADFISFSLNIRIYVSCSGTQRSDAGEA